MHWWPHLLSWPRPLDPVSWFWLSTKGYAFTSSGLQLSIPVGIVMFWRQRMCSVPWCMRFGKHPTADGHHKLCRKHHPDLPNKKPTLQEIHRQHEAAKAGE